MGVEFILLEGPFFLSNYYFPKLRYEAVYGIFVICAIVYLNSTVEENVGKMAQNKLINF